MNVTFGRGEWFSEYGEYGGEHSTTVDLLMLPSVQGVIDDFKESQRE